MQKYDYLFLLVGRNPLPNYVAAHHLIKRGGQVILLHSPGSKGDTHRLAGILKDQIDKGLDCAAEPRDLPSVGAVRISNRITSIVSDLKIERAAAVGFNYTGGTKPMAVHVYRTLAKELGNRVEFSYLNGQDLRLYVDGQDSIAANDGSLQLTLEKLAALHGYQLKENGNTRRKPEQAELAQAVMQVNRTRPGQLDWLTWRSEEDDGLPAGKLPAADKYPALQPFLDALHHLCDGKPTPTAVARLFGFEELIQCSKWFNGGWLEDVALAAVRANLRKFKIQDEQYMGGLKLVPTAALGLKTSRDFESDVLVVKGFQVFLLSCIANSIRIRKGKVKNARSETKKHLFEAYTRARQLGGDEARAAVVCLLDDPQSLADEINREWLPPGGIRVFGKDELPVLSGHLRQWFRGR